MYSFMLEQRPKILTAALIIANDKSHTNINGMYLYNFNNSDNKKARKFADWSSESAENMDN